MLPLGLVMLLCLAILVHFNTTNDVILLNIYFLHFSLPLVLIFGSSESFVSQVFLHPNELCQCVDKRIGFSLLFKPTLYLFVSVCCKSVIFDPGKRASL